MALKIYNSLAREKQIFEPINPNHVRLYACGPTVYSYAHIGNGRMAVVFDLLTRLLKTLYTKVTYVSNITDVDDKIMKAAAETGEEISAITEKYAAIYNDDMATMGVLPPDVQPRATEHIQDMVSLIETLVQKGHAYMTDQREVLFHVPSFDGYGGLSGRSRDEQIAGARVEVSSHKKDPADFILWKPSTDDEPGWDSPWGRGRPGWHIECSAMAEQHLGLPFDIHGGGADLKFPHHENEIAQSCCAHNTAHDLAGYAKYWMHNGFVTVNGEKMSKSIGNIQLVHDLLEHYKGEVLRMTLLSAHYKQPLDWSEDKLQQNQKVLDRLYKRLEGENIDESVEIPAAILDALCDDLNTPKAFSELISGDYSPSEIKVAGNLLGLLQQTPEEWLGYGATNDGIDASYVEALLEERQNARASKNFARADEIRDELTAMNIVIEDTPDGPKWKAS